MSARSAWPIGVSLALTGVLSRCAPFSGTASGTADGGATIDTDAGTLDAATTIEGGADASGGSDAYRDAVLADAPIGYWRLNETNGPIAKDEMGRFDGTYGGACTFGVAGATRFGTAVAFDGASCQVDLRANFLFQMNLPFSIEVWVVADAGTYLHVFTHEARTNGAPTDGYALLLDSPTSAYAERFGIGGASRTSDATLVPGRYVHLVTTYDGSTLALFVDGALSVKTTATAMMRDFSVHAFIGCAGTSNFFKGKIDEVAVYDKALSATRVQAHHDAAAL
jgi:hypothetical protein